MPVTLHSETAKYARELMVFFNQINFFLKEHEKYFLKCENYFGNKIILVIGNFSAEILFIFRDSIRTQIKFVPCIINI